MFNDSRSKKVIFIAHCIQNQNSISDGTADYPGALEDVMALLMSTGVGIVQMPCPELMCLGLDRRNIHGLDSPVVEENTRIRNLLLAEPSRKKLGELVHQVVWQILAYQKYNFTVLGIVGINRSPSCGVDTTSKHNREVKGHGLFIEGLKNELKRNQLHVPLLGIRATEINKAIKSLAKLLHA